MGVGRMLHEGEMSINESRYEEIIRLGYESAKKNIDLFELKYSCTFLDMDSKLKGELAPEEYDEWRISCFAVKTLGERIN